MEPVKFETVDLLKCPNCGEEVDQCDRCNCALSIEMGEEIDGYCDSDNFEHLCVDCKEGADTSTSTSSRKVKR